MVADWEHDRLRVAGRTALADRRRWDDQRSAGLPVQPADTGDSDPAAPERVARPAVARRAAEGDFVEIDLSDAGRAYGPTWSPDGNWILATIVSSADGNQDLYAIAPDGSTKIRLTTSVEAEAYADWAAAAP